MRDKINLLSVVRVIFTGLYFLSTHVVVAFAVDGRKDTTEIKPFDILMAKIEGMETVPVVFSNEFLKVRGPIPASLGGRELGNEIINSIEVMQKDTATYTDTQFVYHVSGLKKIKGKTSTETAYGNFILSRYTEEIIIKMLTFRLVNDSPSLALIEHIFEDMKKPEISSYWFHCMAMEYEGQLFDHEELQEFNMKEKAKYLLNHLHEKRAEPFFEGNHESPFEMASLLECWSNRKVMDAANNAVFAEFFYKFSLQMLIEYIRKYGHIPSEFDQFEKNITPILAPYKGQTIVDERKFFLTWPRYIWDFYRSFLRKSEM